MKSTNGLVLILIILGIMMPGYAQNLVQNPSFESPVSWDDLWLLSTTAPSTATAVATEITSDAHQGSTSVELSNSDTKQWTYFFTDSVNAPFSFMANQRYEVKGWIKSVEEGKKVELSIVWNNKLNKFIFYNVNPDPVTNPDWFMVKDTITATADFNDGFISLGFQNDKAGALPVGRLLLDDFSVTRIPSNLTEVTDFSIPEQTGPAAIDNLLQTVTLEVPFSTDITALVPTIDLSLGASINPAGGVSTDFTAPVVYTVTAEDGIATQDWTVTVTLAPPSTENDILTFDFAEQTGPPAIDNVLHNVITEVAYGTDVTALVPTIGVSPGATINPASGFAVDFSGPVIYTVRAEDGTSVQNYIVAAMVSTISNETDIISFTLAEQADPATIDNLLHTISIDVIYGTDVTSLVPTIGSSAGATINPISGVGADFSAPVVYTVTAEDGTTIQDWTISVTVLPNTETEVVGFTLTEQAGPATIHDLLHVVSIDVPYAIDVTVLAPTIDLSAGATINPASGVAEDFSIPVVYTVTANDGVTVQDWTVFVFKLPNTETDVTGFTLAEQHGPAIIDNLMHTVSIDVPYGTGITSLVPTIELSAGASINPASGVAEDFSIPATYIVSAEDGAAFQDWTITVTVLPNTETVVTAFSLVEETGPAVIDTLLNSVSIDVPNGTDVTALVPDIQLSEGATINPASGEATDFSAPAVFTVTAEDGTSIEDWTVTVVIPFNSETNVVDFSLPEQSGPPTIDDLLQTVSIDVPYATDVAALVPSFVLSSGATINPASGVSTDFSSTVVYTVTAADGTTTQDWTVSVNVLLNHETDVVDCSLVQQTGSAFIDDLQHTVSVEVPYTTDVSDLVPSFVLSTGATIDPAGGVSTDFSSNVVYTVTAEDGVATQDWTVTVTAALNNETDIVSFALVEQTGAATIDNLQHTVVLEVAKGTDLTALVPTIGLSAGATVDPFSGIAVDFSSTVLFTITADDGVTTQEWSVTVTVDPAVSVEAAFESNSIHVYPNPAREVLYVEIPGKGHIYVQDMLGRVITSFNDASFKTTIPVAEFDRGVYFIQVICDDFKHLSKIVLE